MDAIPSALFILWAHSTSTTTAKPPRALDWVIPGMTPALVFAMDELAPLSLSSAMSGTIALGNARSTRAAAAGTCAGSGRQRGVVVYHTLCTSHRRT